MGFYLLPKRCCYGNLKIWSVTYRFESSSATQNSSVSRDSSVRVNRLLEADSVETFWKRSSLARATESKDVEVPRYFKNRVASVSPSVEGDRRSVQANRTFFFYFDADDESRWGTKATMPRYETTSDFDNSRRTFDVWADGRRQGEIWRHRGWLYDVMSTFYNVEHKISPNQLPINAHRYL